MKKLLSLIGTFALIVTTTSPVMACLGQAARVVTDLDKILTNTTLNPIYIGQRNKPNGQEIKDAIKKKNSNVDIDAIVISDITKESAIVTSNNTKYTGAAVTVKFISTNFTELKGITGAVISNLIVFNKTIYLGTFTGVGAIKTGKLYRSTDGTNFLTVAEKDITGAVGILTVFNNALYVVTAINNSSGKVVSNLYKSTDGISFEDVTTTANITGLVNCLIVFNNALYVGTETSDNDTGKLYKSTNGINFTIVAEKDITGAVKSFNITNGIIYVVTVSSNGTLVNLYWSDDGITFTEIKGIFGLIKSWIVFNNTIYFGTAFSDSSGKLYGKLYKSTNTAGTTFEDITTTANITGLVNCLIVFNNALYVGTKTSDDDTGKLYKSTDGINFTIVAEKDITGAVTSLIVFNKVLYVGTTTSKTTGNLFRSTDGTAFEDITEKENITGAVRSLDVTNDIIYVITITATDSTTGKLYKSDNW